MATNFELTKSWFGSNTPKNAKKASQTIGSGDNGTVTAEYDLVGTEGNDYTIEVVEGSGLNVDMTAELVGTAITVTLGTDGAGALDATKNTATLIAAAIDALTNINGTASGTGADAIGAAEAEQDFAGGQYATVAPVPYTMLYDTSYYYVNIAPNSEVDTNWRRFTLSSF